MDGRSAQVIRHGSGRCGIAATMLTLSFWHSDAYCVYTSGWCSQSSLLAETAVNSHEAMQQSDNNKLLDSSYPSLETRTRRHEAEPRGYT